MFDIMRRLHPRGAASRGISVDAHGAMLGPSCILVDRSSYGYTAIERTAAAALQKSLLDTGHDPDWLFQQCGRIADALNRGEVALAQIYGLRIPIDDLSATQFDRVAVISSLFKAGFDPDEPRVPKGDPRGGQWTSEGGGSAEDAAGDAPSEGGSDANVDGASGETGQTAFYSELGADESRDSAPEFGNADPNLIPAAYQGDYHNVLVEAYAKYLEAKGATILTAVPLTFNGTTAVADLVVYIPGYGTIVIEVKTGENPTFTDSQRRIYPMVQFGGHVTSSKANLGAVGLTPGTPLPPLEVWVYGNWVRDCREKRSSCLRRNLSRSPRSRRMPPSRLRPSMLLQGALNGDVIKDAQSALRLARLVLRILAAPHAHSFVVEDQGDRWSVVATAAPTIENTSWQIDIKKEDATVFSPQHSKQDIFSNPSAAKHFAESIIESAYSRADLEKQLPIAVSDSGKTWIVRGSRNSNRTAEGFGPLNLEFLKEDGRVIDLFMEWFLDIPDDIKQFIRAQRKE